MTTPEQIDPVNVLMIEAVGPCNATCPYCPRGAGLLPKTTNSYLTFQILEKALTLAKAGHQRGVYLHHRGEPFLHPDLPAIIRRVREAGYFAYLSSNLISVTEERARLALLAGLNDFRMHFTAGLTKLGHEQLLERVHMVRRLNWELRNDGCRLEVTYALQGAETPESVRATLSQYPYFDERMHIDFYSPHNWASLATMVDRGVDPKMCKWYTTRSCAILSSGDLVICCLDQFSHSKTVNIMEIDEIRWAMLNRRAMCKGCVQQFEMDDWLEAEALRVPRWLSRRLEFDPWT